MANEEDSFFLSSMVVIPTSPAEESEFIEDPRIPHQYCLSKHEKTKKFLSSNVTCHKLISSSFPDYNCSSSNLNNAHNFELISNPRNSIFFSLHGPEYNKIVKFFDPRLTKSCDILGQTIFGDQAFIDVDDEIPATNDIIFENLVLPFCHEGPLDLNPLELGDIERDDGELTRSFYVSDNAPDTSESESETVGDENDGYQNLLIDILFSKGSKDIQSKLKSFEKIRKYFDVPKNGVPGPESPIHSFVLERSLSEPQQNTPVRRPLRQTTLNRLASDPNSSFIMDLNNRSCVTSTPDTNKLEKRKLTESAISPLVPRLQKRIKMDDKNNRSSMLDVGLKTIRELKGADGQVTVEVLEQPPEQTLEQTPEQTPEPDTVESQLLQLDVKDRGIGRGLSRHCSCWVEERKHEKCVEGYGEFVVSINNRYGHDVQIEILNKALTILSHAPLDPTNVILKLSLFSSELLKTLQTQSS